MQISYELCKYGNFVSQMNLTVLGSCEIAVAVRVARKVVRKNKPCMKKCSETLEIHGNENRSNFILTDKK